MGRYAGGARAWWALCAAALVTGGAFAILFTGETVDGGGFGPLSLVALSGGGAFWAMVFAALAAVLVGSSGGYRFALILPATALYTLLAVYGPPPLWPGDGWRDLLARWQEWLFRIGADVYTAANTMYAEPIPYDLEPGLLLVMIPIVMIVVAFATSATLYENSPVISVAVLGITIGVLSTISFEDGAGPFFALFLISAVALLLFSGGAASREGLIGRAGLVAGACVVALVLVLPKAPFSDQTLSSGAIDWTRLGAGGTSRLNVQADVGDYLTYGREAELMRVRSSEPLYWRGGTLDYFDGARWSDTTEPGEGYGEEVSPLVETRPVLQSFQILDARTDRIFGAYRVVQPSANLEGARQNSDGSWSVDEPLTEGSYYRVISEIPQPTEAQLQGAGTGYPAEVEQKFLQLPEDRPGVIAGTARKIQRDYNPQTPYEQARAIERYLIYDGNFTYNLDVNYGRADEAIEEFLGDGREGFCVQFATSMVLIAREMGVPARVVYGATQGEEVEPGEWVVKGANMHTWVEIYFPGVGWYPFDPTPGFSMPSAMQANAPRPVFSSSQAGALPSENAELRQRQQEQRQAPEEEQQRPGQQRNAASAGGGNVAWPFYALLPVLLIAAVPLTKRVLLARGRPEDFYRDLTGRLRDVLPPGGGALADSPALTPTERMLLLSGAAGVEEGPFGEFAEAYSEHLYAPGPDRRRDRRISATYRRAMRAYEELPRWRRLLAAVNPASLLARAGKGLAAARLGVGKRLRRFRDTLRRR